jgi:hypothetical protein
VWGQRGNGRHVLKLQRPAITVKLTYAHLAAEEYAGHRVRYLAGGWFPSMSRFRPAAPIRAFTHGAAGNYGPSRALT